MNSRFEKIGGMMAVGLIIAAALPVVLVLGTGFGGSGSELTTLNAWTGALLVDISRLAIFATYSLLFTVVAARELDQSMRHPLEVNMRLAALSQRWVGRSTLFVLMLWISALFFPIGRWLPGAAAMLTMLMVAACYACWLIRNGAIDYLAAQHMPQGERNFLGHLINHIPMQVVRSWLLVACMTIPCLPVWRDSHSFQTRLITGLTILAASLLIARLLPMLCMASWQAEPLEDEELEARLRELASRYNLAVPELLVVTSNERSSFRNDLLFPGDPHRFSYVLNRATFQALSRDELAAMLFIDMQRYSKHHMHILTRGAIIVQVLVMIAASWLAALAPTSAFAFLAIALVLAGQSVARWHLENARGLAPGLILEMDRLASQLFSPELVIQAIRKWHAAYHLPLKQEQTGPEIHSPWKRLEAICQSFSLDPALHLPDTTLEDELQQALGSSSDAEPASILTGIHRA